jgi:hypothetical protein
LETKGWNALHELPGMFEMIRSLDESGRMVQAYLGVEKRSDKAGGKTRHYVVPKLTVGQSPQELQSGQASVAAISTGPVAALSSGGEVPDDILDMLWEDAVAFGLDEPVFVKHVLAQTKNDVSRINVMRHKLHAGTIVPVIEDGELRWLKK